MVLTILFAVPGILILLALAATPLFTLWDDRASQSAARRPRDTEVAIPSPRGPVDAVLRIPVSR
ncbi:hypothetical protein [Pseudonocardia endophytica]|nr:hypothetical protein [Pseudonocardia endophytica]